MTRLKRYRRLFAEGFAKGLPWGLILGALLMLTGCAPTHTYNGTPPPPGRCCPADPGENAPRPVQLIPPAVSDPGEAAPDPR